jgi:hypothetical protein
MHGELKDEYRSLSCKFESKRPHGRPTIKWDKIKEIG